MRSNSRLPLTLLAAVVLSIAGAMAADKATDEASDEQTEQRLPEHRARPLPTDTFKPSEEISEDFPVPFPVDI